MKKSINKHLAKLIVALLIISVFSAIFSFADVTQAAVPDNEPGRDVEIQGITGDMDDSPYQPHGDDCTVGESYVMFDLYISIENDVNVTSVSINEEPTILDEDVSWNEANSTHWSTPTTDPISNWIDSEAIDGHYNETESFWNDFYVSNYFDDLDDFGFNVSSNAEPGVYNLSVTFTYEKQGTGGEWTDYEQNQNILFRIVPNTVRVHDETVSPLSDEFTTMDIRVDHYDFDVPGNYYDGDQNLLDVTLELDENDLTDGDGDRITIHDPNDRVYRDRLNLGNTEFFTFRITVPREMNPGDYDVDYTLEGTRETDGTDITTEGSFMITVFEYAEITATINVENKTFEQGTAKREFTVSFENTGNVDLERVEIMPEVDTNPYYYLPQEFYDKYGNPDTNESWMELGDLGMEEQKELTFAFGINSKIPLGLHELHFFFNSYFYDEEGDITGTGDGGYIQVSNYYSSGIPLSDEATVKIEVIEGELTKPIEATGIDAVRISDMGYNQIDVTIQNTGYVTYSDVSVVMHTAGTPFLNPEDEQENTIEMMDDPFTLFAGNSRTITFGVSVDTSFIEERLENDQPIYSVGFTFNGLNTDIVEEEEITFTTKGEVRGIGPKIMIKGQISDNEIKAGDNFELTYYIENTGDEPVRDLTVRLSPHQEGGQFAQLYFEDKGVEFSSGEEAVYYKQATSSPGAYVWVVEPSDKVLQPGESTNVTFQMIPSSDMQEGAIYHMDLSVSGTTAAGQESWDSSTTIRTAEGDSAKPMLTTELTWILVALIAGIFFAIGMYILKREKKPETEETEEEVEEEYTFEESKSIEPETSEESYEEEPTEYEWNEEEVETEPETEAEDEVFEEDESEIEPEEREW